MYKILFILFCAFLSLLEPQSAAATSSSDIALTEAGEAALSRAIPRPTYKKYRGNSRSKRKRLGPFRRWAAYRKAKRKRKAKATAPRKGVISVDPPTRNQ